MMPRANGKARCHWRGDGECARLEGYDLKKVKNTRRVRVVLNINIRSGAQQTEVRSNAAMRDTRIQKRRAGRSTGKEIKPHITRNREEGERIIYLKGIKQGAGA